MTPFEIHITGNHTINKELDKLGIKNIVVELLTPDLRVLREEYMSSFIWKGEYKDVHNYVMELVTKLKIRKCGIIRVKIECPPIEQLFPMSLYMEAHFEVEKSSSYPISRNKKKTTLLATKREYTKQNYFTFIERNLGAEVELCIFDSWKEEDEDWFNLYKS